MSHVVMAESVPEFHVEKGKNFDFNPHHIQNVQTRNSAVVQNTRKISFTRK